MKPRTSARARALEQAAAIAEHRARVCMKTLATWVEKYPHDVLGQDVERQCAREAELIASEIRKLIIAPRHNGGPSLGGKTRAASLSPERRAEIARQAANARWQS